MLGVKRCHNSIQAILFHDRIDIAPHVMQALNALLESFWAMKWNGMMDGVDGVEKFANWKLQNLQIEAQILKERFMDSLRTFMYCSET